MEHLKFKYRNWKGCIGERTVIPLEIVFTVSSYHGENKQWFLKALDTQKGEERMFLLKDIQEWL